MQQQYYYYSGPPESPSLTLAICAPEIRWELSSDSGSHDFQPRQPDPSLSRIKKSIHPKSPTNHHHARSCSIFPLARTYAPAHPVEHLPLRCALIGRGRTEQPSDGAQASVPDQGRRVRVGVRGAGEWNRRECEWCCVYGQGGGPLEKSV